MSQWRGRLEDTPELESAIDWVTDNYHVPVVALLLAFMLWSRLRGWQNFVVDGKVLFSGNDAWYHYRTVTYTVKHWPATMPYDPWTYFPHGTASGQFGTLFDQIIATVALVVGLGSPSQQTVAMTLLVAPAFFGVAAAIPTYFIGRRLGGRIGGVTAVTVLAFSIGSFFVRSRVGFSDHHVAEALFQTLGVLAVIVAVSVAQRDKPIYEQIVERDVESLRSTVLWAALAGFAMTLYLWVWPFGVLLMGIVGVYLFLQMNVEVLRGESPEHTAFAGAVAFGVTGLIMLSSMQTSTITATDFSLLHPLLAFGVAGGSVFMAWLARRWEERDLDATLYPVSTVGIIVLGAVLVAVLLPDVYGYFAGQLGRIFGLGFSVSETASSVGEVQPLVDWSREGLGAGIDQLYGTYGFALFAALFGAVVILGRQFGDDHVPAGYMLVVVWAVFITAATFTQARFQYYLVFPVAVLTGYAVSIVVGMIDLDASSSLDDIEVYQVVAVLATVLVLLAPIAPTAFGVASPSSPAAGPGSDIKGWNGALEWMNSNTPAEGEFNGSESDLDLYGTYAKQDNYDYESGAYGVLSWWDYGHWITAIGERIPNANPFQQGATSAANFLIAPTESQANDVLSGMNEDDAKTRYVMIDSKMVNTYTNYRGKFFAPTRFYNKSDVSVGQYTQRIGISGGFSQVFRYQTQKYYDTTVVRLYKFHGSAVEPEPVVLNWGRQQTQSGRSIPAISARSMSVQQYNSMEAARQAAENDSTAVVGGFAGKPSERVPAMKHYRLVGASERSATTSQSYNRKVISTAEGVFGGNTTAFVTDKSQCPSDVTVSARSRARNGSTINGHVCVSKGAVDYLQPTEPRYTKVFERVPGATIEGTGPANSTVSAQVEMQMPGTNETFTYRQQAKTGDDGTFTMTVPYSTTGYEKWGPEEGHTDVSVRANSSYQFQTIQRTQNGSVFLWSGSANVTEGQVIGEDQSVTTVDLDRSKLELSQGNDTGSTNATESGNATDGGTDSPLNDTSGTDGASNGTSGDGTSDGTTTATPSNASGSLVARAAD